jgi:hypothetical protein
MTWMGLDKYPDTSWMQNAVFGCDVIGHIPPEKRKKYDNPGFRGSFAGWDMDRKCAIIWDYVGNCARSVRNVKFFPTQFTNGEIIAEEYMTQFLKDVHELEESMTSEEKSTHPNFQYESEEIVYTAKEEDLDSDGEIPDLEKDMSDTDSDTDSSSDSEESDSTDDGNDSNDSDFVPSRANRTNINVSNLSRQQMLELHIRRLELEDEIRDIEAREEEDELSLMKDKPEDKPIRKPIGKQDPIKKKEKRKRIDNNAHTLRDNYHTLRTNYTSRASAQARTRNYTRLATELNQAKKANYEQPKVPRSLWHAMNDPLYADSGWKESAEEEVQGIWDDKVWHKVKKPTDAPMIDLLTTFVVKADGRKKTRICARGDQEDEGKMGNIHATVIHKTTLKIALSIIAIQDLEWRTFDVTGAFRKTPVEAGRDIFIRIPKGFPGISEEEQRSCCFKLDKYLYGTKEAAARWQDLYTDYLLREGFKNSDKDVNFFWKIEEDGRYSIMTTYVDDNLMGMATVELLDRYEEMITKEFEIVADREPAYYVGWNIARDREHKVIFISQERYLDKIRDKFGEIPERKIWIPMEASFDPTIEEAQPSIVDSKPYSTLLGCLMHTMQTRPELSLAINMLGSYAANAQEKHWKALKRIFHHAIQTKDLGCLLGCLDHTDLQSYSDANFKSEKQGRSRGGGVTFYFGGAIGYFSKLQKTPALSTTETELMALTENAKMIRFCQEFLDTIGFDYETPTTLRGDNKGANILGESDVLHDRTKHIATRHFVIRHWVKKGLLKIEYVPTEDNISDIFTKPLARPRFEKLRMMLNVRSFGSISTVKDSKSAGGVLALDIEANRAMELQSGVSDEYTASGMLLRERVTGT